MKWPFGPRPALDPRAAPISGATPDVARPPRTRAGVARRARVGSRTRLRLDGARAVWLPAGVIGAVMAAIVVWQLAMPRDFYAGTNSVGVRSVVANLVPGQKLCVPGLNLPAGTGRVQLALFAHRPQFAARFAVSTAVATSSAKVVATPGPTSLTYAVAPIPVRPAHPSSVPATVCVTPIDGPLAVGGMIGLQANQLSPRVNGAPLGNRVGVWFLPPVGEQRSLFASLGAIFQRAALFRPGIIGPWTYPVLLFAVLPGIWLLSLLLLARASVGRSLRLLRRKLRPAAAIALIAFVNAGSWALITPAFNAPDEPSHFAYAQYFAETGHAPARVPDARPPDQPIRRMRSTLSISIRRPNCPTAARRGWP